MIAVNNLKLKRKKTSIHSLSYEGMCYNIIFGSIPKDGDDDFRCAELKKKPYFTRDPS